MPAKPPISFTVEDLKQNGQLNAHQIERVLRQFERAIQTPAATTATTATTAPTAIAVVATATARAQSALAQLQKDGIDTTLLVKQIVELIRPELQATGSAPLDIQNLLPFDAHAEKPGEHTIRLAKLTPDGTDGSISWSADGVIRSFVDPT